MDERKSSPRVDLSLLKELPLSQHQCMFEEKEKQLSCIRGLKGLDPTRGLVWVNSEILAPGQIVPTQSEATARFHYCFGREFGRDSQAEPPPILPPPYLLHIYPPMASAATTHTHIYPGSASLPLELFVAFRLRIPSSWHRGGVRGRWICRTSRARTPAMWKMVWKKHTVTY